MAQRQNKITGLRTVDPVWQRIRDEAAEIASREPALASFIFATILHHDSLEQAIAQRIVDRLEHPSLAGELIRQAYDELFDAEPSIAEVFRADIGAVSERDPATSRFIEPVLYFKGFHALQTYRLAHFLWKHGRQDFALYLQSRSSAVFGVDIHPNAKIGRGIFFDHATGIVIGATAVIDDDVSMLHGVTLGGAGKERGDRHPKIRRGVLIGAGAKILGNIEVGACARVAAGSVVLKAVPANMTVAGIPARVVGKSDCSDSPAHTMDHFFDMPPFAGEAI
jgi:serine O-acetyltransferase